MFERSAIINGYSDGGAVYIVSFGCRLVSFRFLFTYFILSPYDWALLNKTILHQSTAFSENLVVGENTHARPEFIDRSSKYQSAD